MIRFLQQGQPAKTLPCSFDSTAGDILALGGGSRQVPPGSSVTVNGTMSSTDASVKPGDTVALQPNGDLG